LNQQRSVADCLQVDPGYDSGCKGIGEAKKRGGQPDTESQQQADPRNAKGHHQPVPQRAGDVPGFIVGKNVLRDLVPLPVVSHLCCAVAEKPEDGTYEETILVRYVEQRGPVNFLPQVLVFGLQD